VVSGGASCGMSSGHALGPRQHIYSARSKVFGHPTFSHQNTPFSKCHFNLLPRSNEFKTQAIILDYRKYTMHPTFIRFRRELVV